MTTLIDFIALGLLPDTDELCLLAPVSGRNDEFDLDLPARLISCKDVPTRFWDEPVALDGGNRYQFFGVCSDICRNSRYGKGTEAAKSLIFETEFNVARTLMRKAFSFMPDGILKTAMEKIMLRLTRAELISSTQGHDEDENVD